MPEEKRGLLGRLFRRGAEDQAAPPQEAAPEAALPSPRPLEAPLPEAEPSPPLSILPPSDLDLSLPEPVAAEPQAPASPEEKKRGFFSRAWEALNRPVFTIETEQLAEKLSKTRAGLVEKVRKLARGRTRIDEELLEELEEILLEADVGVAIAEGAITHLRRRARAGELLPEGLSEALEAYLAGQLGDASPLALRPDALNIVLIVGVNGVGKTTTLGKLAARLAIEGHRPLIAAADTFRAAAIDQLAVWAERAGVDIIRHQEGGDAAAVVFDAIRAARARGSDVLLVDTAGRLHNKANLMAELAKIRRIIDREAPEAPIEALLVLDATTGQNGLRQAEVFSEAVKLTGVVLTKLDGTAKGGVVFGIRQALGTPVKLIGVGEQLADLKDFVPGDFVRALFETEEGPDEALAEPYQPL